MLHNCTDCPNKKLSGLCQAMLQAQKYVASVLMQRGIMKMRQAIVITAVVLLSE
jgi:hypothetical protein